VKTESKEQMEVIQWCKRNTHLYPELDEIFWIRNESKSRRVRIMGKLMGIKPGTPDLLLPVARRNFHGLFIEMKSMVGSLSPAQKKRIPKLKAQGYAVIMCKGAAKAIHLIKSYLNI